jgi:hypothetical protein
MDFNQAMGQIRPILGIVGALLIAAGVLKFFGVNIPISGSGLEIGVAGFLTKSI